MALGYCEFDLAGYGILETARSIVDTASNPSDGGTLSNNYSGGTCLADGTSVLDSDYAMLGGLSGGPNAGAVTLKLNRIMRRRYPQYSGAV
jgi:hypothetical protein